MLKEFFLLILKLFVEQLLTLKVTSISIAVTKSKLAAFAELFDVDLADLF